MSTEGNAGEHLAQNRYTKVGRRDASTQSFLTINAPLPRRGARKGGTIS